MPFRDRSATRSRHIVSLVNIACLTGQVQVTFRRMFTQEVATDVLSLTVLDNRAQRGRMQAELVLIQSLSLALDAQVNFELATSIPEQISKDL